MNRMLLIASLFIFFALPLAAQEEENSAKNRTFLLSLSTALLDYTYVDQPYDHNDGTDFVSLGGQLTSLDTAFGFGLADTFYLMGRFGFGVNWGHDSPGDTHPLHSFLIVGFGPRISMEMSNILVNIGAYLNYRYDNGFFSYLSGTPYLSGNYNRTWGHTLSLEGYGGAEYLATDNFAIGLKLSLAYYHLWQLTDIGGGNTHTSHVNGINLGLHLSSSIFF